MKKKTKLKAGDVCVVNAKISFLVGQNDIVVLDRPKGNSWWCIFSQGKKHYISTPIHRNYLTKIGEL